MGNCSVVVLDFETTGLSPHYGDRAIEIGAVLISDNEIVDRFQSLMNPGMRISSFIEDYTGITNKMLSTAPPVDEVMADFHSFMDQHHLVAHNAGFDCRFLDAELDRIRRKRVGEFACSMLLSRRIYPEAPNHKLETLVRYKKLKTTGVHHRALADAEMTGHLWIEILNNLKESFDLRDVSFDFMRRLSKVPKAKVPLFLKKAAEEQGY
ncbi:MAG: DNA polymerase III subunit epsilon [Spirochaetae bacterium HGW-Spirochaetae-5]|nr:MAG: DNA polymerase III subunit epsilon [Spirochaetae bacterium HGW-Spirochaetae-5]